jgi:TPP-dependent pyruvate/acetoin dehydrogenase alpha subunit
MEKEQLKQPQHTNSELSSEFLVDMFRSMHLIRAFEKMAEKSYARGKIHGTMHLAIGQEASAVGTIAALDPDDYVLNTHRGHGVCIAKGVEIPKMVAEFYGKETGYCRGRGGSMHIANVEVGNLGANGVVAGGIPLAVGVGLSIKMLKSDQIVMCFFGDGAANSGAFHESLNMAAIWSLPIVFVCENNQYAMSYPIDKAIAIDSLADRAASYGMPGQAVDGNDILAVYEGALLAVDRARSGEGPSLLVNETYRWRGHSKSDRNLYRTKAEIEIWQQKDPLTRFGDYLKSTGILTEEGAETIENEAKLEIQAGVKFAEESPEPSIESIEEGVYAP